MLGRKTKTKSKICTIDVFLDFETFDKFMLYAKKNDLGESEALAEVLQRGMSNYRILEYKRLKENYKRIESLHNEYKKDYEILAQLEHENENLKNTLECSNHPQPQETDSS